MAITRLKQNEGLVSGKINGISSESIISTAKKDFCIVSINAVWPLTGDSVLIIAIFVVPLNVSVPESW